MSLVDLGVIYLIGGLASSVAVFRLHRSLGSALLALVLWPLWAPFAFMDPERQREPRSPASREEVGAGILVVLDEARKAASGTPFEAMLNDGAAARIALEIERASERLAGLEEVLAQPEFSREAAKARLAALAAEGASEAGMRPARLHLESVERLGAMHAHQRAALSELEEVLSALRTQLVVARYAGAPEGVEGIVGDLWARVEGLGEAFEEEGDPPAGGVQSCEPMADSTVFQREAS